MIYMPSQPNLQGLTKPKYDKVKPQNEPSKQRVAIPKAKHSPRDQDTSV